MQNSLPFTVSPYGVTMAQLPDSDFARTLQSAGDLIETNPQLLVLIENDLRKAGLAKKETRLKDRIAAHGQDPLLPGTDVIPPMVLE